MTGPANVPGRTGTSGMPRQPQSGFITRAGVRLHYVDWPAASPTAAAEPPLLCIHGLTANARCWDALAAALPHRRIVAVDLRGRGLSGRPADPTAYGPEQHAADCAAVADTLGLRQVTAIGHSLGAFVAATFAATYPDLVSRLVLVDGAHANARASAAQTAAQISGALARLNRTFPSLDAYFDYWRQTGVLGRWQPFVKTYLTADADLQPDGTVRTRAAAHAVAADMQAVGTEWDNDAVFSRINQPTAVLWAPEPLVPGGQPLITEAGLRETAQFIQNASFQTIAGANHYTILLEPSCVSALANAIST